VEFKVHMAESVVVLCSGKDKAGSCQTRLGLMLDATES
jgi:hypothetical protein